MRDAFLSLCWFRIAVVGAILATPSLGSAADDWLTKVYRVEVELSPSFHPDKVAIVNAIAAGLGPACVLVQSEGEDSSGSTKSPTPGEVPESRQSAGPDKRIRISIESEAGGVRVRAVEDDLWLHHSSEPVSRLVIDERYLAETAAQLAARVFRERFKIERFDDGYVGTVWGGRIDESLRNRVAWLQPFVRFHDRDLEWRQTQEIRWTYLRTEQASTESRLSHDMSVESAYPRPLPGRLRRGTIVALRVPATCDQTTVRLVDRDRRHPRPGIRVDVKAVGSDGHSSPQAEAGRPSRSVRANRLGRFQVPAWRDSAGELDLVRFRVLTTDVVADVPFLPGSIVSIDLPIMNDIERVELDEQLTVIETRLQDLVAQRSLLIAKIEADVEAKRWEAVESRLQELGAIPESRSLLIDLNAATVRAVRSAESRGDRTLASRLKRRAKRLEETLNSFDDPDVENDFRDEIKTLKEIEEAAAKFRAETEVAIPEN